MRPFSQRLVSHLSTSKRVAVLTGAGISAESGVATFRDAGGLWDTLEPEELASFAGFMSNPELVQRWYAHRREVVSNVRPNPGHIALAKMEELFDEFTVITQNVDNLHQRAGSTNIIELHGNMQRNYCISCGRNATDSEVESPDADGLFRCPECGGLIRPDVVWFGEMLPHGAMERADQVARHAEVFLSIGTSAVVYPAASIPITARLHGAYVAEINLERSAIGLDLDEIVLGPAGVVLPQLLEAVRTEKGHRNAGRS